MTLRDPNRGWSDPIGTFMRLQIAVTVLTSDKYRRAERIDRATSALSVLIPAYFPPTIREKAERVLAVRKRVQRKRKSNVAPFRLLKANEYEALTTDILSLYEDCIFDMSEEIKDIVHPRESRD